MSFEKEFLKFVQDCPSETIHIEDFSSSKKEFDFRLFPIDTPPIWVDVKEKKQPYNTKTWETTIPEEEFFIIDERALMKAWGLGYHCGIVVKDVPRGLYHFFSSEVLCFMPRIRGYREVSNGPMGKLLVDFRWAVKNSSLSGILEEIIKFNREASIPKNLYPDFKGQDILKVGQFRNSNWQKTDFKTK